MDPINKYLTITHRAERIERLRELTKKGITIPIDLVEDLLMLDISTEEKSLLIEAVRSDDLGELEDFYLRGGAQWSQDLAVIAVRQWCSKTPQKKYLRWTEIIRNPTVSQRVFYTIIEKSFSTGGALLLKSALEVDGLMEMSHAVHGLLLLRALQWNLSSNTLKKVALKGIHEQGNYFASDHRATMPAVAYLLKNEPGLLNELAQSPKCHEIYKQLILSLQVAWQHESERLEKNKTVSTSQSNPQELSWPSLWHRSFLSVETISQHIQQRAQILLPAPQGRHTSKQANGVSPPSHDHQTAHLEGNAWEEFGGIPGSQLLQALGLIEDSRTLVGALNMVGGLVEESDLSTTRDLLAKKNVYQDPFLSLLVVGRFHHAQPTAQAHASLNLSKSNSAPSMRREFFNVAFRGLARQTPPISVLPDDEDEMFWTTLLNLWENPQEVLLSPLAQMIRKRGGLLVLCYLNTLERCRGLDQAALKVLDYIRSDQEDEMRAVIGALAGIDTPRSLQELIAGVTRPNMTRTLQLEALSLLKEHDLSRVQPHLRSAFADLGQPKDPAGLEVRELLSTLLTAAASDIAPSVAQTLAPTTTDQIAWDQTFDHKLARMIQGYKDLSSEVKRALRTSLFFHMQVEQKGTSGLIDLSPIVDMQYKALELLFRESFEDHCSKLINRGVLQRKLDLIGYARPIPQAMDQFENYLCSLPIVRDIPFFSKFKLRKMLRAICQFRPGRRFTLDGLKAFALFFLCFGRKECQYGLHQLIDLGFENDSSLCEFAHLLHIFQDLRNRAAHEGLHPEASSDIERLWIQTAEIIQKHNNVYNFIASHGGLTLQRGNDLTTEKSNPKEPRIIKKVS